MTTYYFDSVLGTDALAGTSKSAAKRDFNPFNGFTPVAGDTLLFKRGSPQTITGAIKSIRGGSSDTARIRYGAYGEAQVPYSIWKYGTGAGNMILNAAQRSYLDFEDMYFDMRSSDCRNSIYLASQGAVESVGVNIRRCFFQGANSPTLHIGNGLGVLQEPSSTAWPRDYNIEDCEFFDNDGHGLIIVGSRNIAVRRCKFYRNGANDPNGGHGFSARYNRTDTTSGWTNTSGTIWKKTLGTAEPDAYYVQTSVPGYSRVRRTAGAATAPAGGEYGVSGGLLYINVNSASSPNGQGVRYAWGICAGLLIENCESHDNYWNAAAPYHEGHGFAFDDFADNSFFLRNKSYNNQGAGFSINRGDRNRIIGNIAYGNWQAGIICSPMDGLNIINNTFYRNNSGTGAHAGEIHSFGNSKDVVISNNIIVSTVGYGISRETTDTGFSGATNNIIGYTKSAEKNAFVTNTVTDDPLLDSLYRPGAAPVKRGGVYLGGKDFNGKQFYNPPSIGAVDEVPSTPRYLMISK